MAVKAYGSGLKNADLNARFNFSSALNGAKFICLLAATGAPGCGAGVCGAAPLASCVLPLCVTCAAGLSCAPAIMRPPAQMNTTPSTMKVDLARDFAMLLNPR